MAYLQPAGFVWPDTVLVFRAVGAERAQRFHLAAHRLAVWRELPGIPEAALGPMLRHELEHARRWERSGTHFFEADDLLRAAVREAGGHGYAALPERARGERRLGRLRAADALGGRARPDSRERRVLGSARRAPSRRPMSSRRPWPSSPARDDWSPWLDGAARASYLDEVRQACAAWNPDVARALTAGGEEPIVELIRPVL